MFNKRDIPYVSDLRPVPYLSGKRPRAAYGKQKEMAKLELRMSDAYPAKIDKKNILIDKAGNRATNLEYLFYLLVTSIITIGALWFFGFV